MLSALAIVVALAHALPFSRQHLIRLKACDPPPQSTLQLGTDVWCEFSIDTSSLPSDRPTQLDVLLRGAEPLPLLAVEYNNTMLVQRHEQGEAMHHAVWGWSSQPLVVIFPYSECTTSGAVISLSVVADDVGNSPTVHFRQARQCIMSSAGLSVEDGRNATLSFMLIVLFIVLILFCLACIYINPRGFQ